MRNVLQVILEAIIIGLITIVIAVVLKTGYYKLTNKLMNKYILIFLSGMIIHLFFEYTGLNESWCTKTYKI